MSYRLFIKNHFPEPAIYPSGALLMGIGNSTSQPVDTGVGDANWLSFFFSNSGATGTKRGEYLRLYLTGGAGGEALRAFTTVSSAAPTDTVNGAHISLNFGSSAGNVTGEVQALRATLQLGNRSMTGTLAAIKAELWADGSSSSVTGATTSAFLRLSAGGDQTGIDKIDDAACLFAIDGLTAGAAHMWRTSLTAGTLNAACTCALRIKVGSTLYYIPVATAASG